jgi:hypothetical protein
MTDPVAAFESRFADRIRAYSDVRIRPVDELAVAHEAAGRQSRWMVPNVRRGWSASPVVAALAVLLVVALLAVVAAGNWLRPRVNPAPPPLPRLGQVDTPRSPDLKPSLVNAGTLRSLVGTSIAVGLRDGRILLGGQASDGSLATIFDPRTGTAAAVDSGGAATAAQFAEQLPDGRVVLYSWDYGEPDGPGQSFVWILDPSTASVSQVHAMPTPRFEPGIAVLTDGRVVISGGNPPDDSATRSSVDAFDPSTGTVAALQPLRQARYEHTLIPLDDGRILVVGGSTAETLVAHPVLDVELYDPRTGQSTIVGAIRAASGRNMSHARPVRLHDGRILIPGPQLGPQLCGYHEIDPTAAYLYDPASSSFTSAPDFPHAITAAVVLPDDRIAIIGRWTAIPGGCGGGDYVTDDWLGVYDLVTGKTQESRNPISGLGTLSVDSNHHYAAAVPLADGTVALIAEDLDQESPTAIDILAVAP